MLQRLLILAAFLLAALAGRARAAEEVIVLDNGTVFRGHVISQRDGEIELRLSGFGRDATVTVAQSRIVSRFVPVRAEHKPDREETPFSDWAGQARVVETDGERTQAGGGALPPEEPRARDEGFFERLGRVTRLSLPPALPGQLLIGLLLFVALFALVTLGGRLAEIESMGWIRTSALAMLLGGFLVADVLHHDALLRADRATWVLPAEGVVWLLVAGALLRCGFARTVLLFAFVLFSLAVMAFAAGAILVQF